MVFITAFPFGCPGAPIETAIPASGVTPPGDLIWAPFCSQHDWEIAQWAKTEHLTSLAFSRLLAIPEVKFFEISIHRSAIQDTGRWPAWAIIWLHEGLKWLDRHQFGQATLIPMQGIQNGKQAAWFPFSGHTTVYSNTLWRHGLCIRPGTCLGFVTGNPWVGYFNTVPMTWQPTPCVVMGLHRTRSLWVSLRCDDNLPRVTKLHQNRSIVAIPWVWVLSSLSIVSLYYSNAMHK